LLLLAFCSLALLLLLLLLLALLLLLLALLMLLLLLLLLLLRCWLPLLLLPLLRQATHTARSLLLLLMLLLLPRASLSCHRVAHSATPRCSRTAATTYGGTAWPPRPDTRQPSTACSLRTNRAEPATRRCKHGGRGAALLPATAATC